MKGFQMRVGLAPASVALGISLTAFVASPASAQSESPAASRAGTGLEEIVVTARRREERLQTVPVAATAITADQITRKQLIDIRDVQSNTPSLSIVTGNMRNIISYAARGESLQTAALTQPAFVVQSYFSEVPTASSTAISQFYDLQSIQVLRGPQGSLFGRQANGGAVLLTPVKPGHKFDGYIQASAGNLAYYAVEGAVTIPLGETLSVRAAGSITRRDGFTKELLSGLDLDNKHSNAWRISALWQPTASFENLLVYDAYDFNQHSGSAFTVLAPADKTAGRLFGAAGLTSYLAGTNPNYPLYDGWLRQYDSVCGANPANCVDKGQGLLISDVAKFDVGSVTIKNIFGYQQERSRQSQDPDGSPFPILDSWTARPGGWYKGVDTITDEFQVSGKALDNRLDFILGGFYQHQNTSPEIALGPFTAFSGSLGRLQMAKSTSHSEAIFGQVSYKILDRLSFTLGARYTWDYQNSLSNAVPTVPIANGVPVGQVSCSGTAAGPLVSPDNLDSCLASGIVSIVKNSGVNWTVGLDYHATDSVLLYVVSRRGYRQGGTNTVPAVATDFFTFKPEKLTDVEAGVKADWQAGGIKGRFNLAAFHNWITNAQKNASFFVGGSTVSAIINAQKANASGVEIEATVIPVPGLELSASGNYTHTKYNKFQYTFPGTATTVDAAGSDFSNTPKYKLNLSATYHLPIPQPLGDEISFNLTAYMQGKFYFADAVNLVQINPDGSRTPSGLSEGGALAPAYTFFNARLDWRNALGRSVDVAVFGRNITNKKYMVGGASSLNSLGIVRASFSEPATYGVQVRFRFGASH